MKYVIIFDMDDTLYDESTYVQSGFQAVSQYLEQSFSIDAEEAYQFMWERLLQDGRGHIFNDVLDKYWLETKERVRECITVYREHRPAIQLPKETIICLKKLSSNPLYVVTDGHVIAQQNKIDALELTNWMKEAIPSYCSGEKQGKPSPYWFSKIIERESITPEQAVYIGDNPRKDFVGIKLLGFKTVRIMTGQHKNVEMPSEYEAEFRIDLLKELPAMLKKIWPDFKTVRK